MFQIFLFKLRFIGRQIAKNEQKKFPILPTSRLCFQQWPKVVIRFQIIYIHPWESTDIGVFAYFCFFCIYEKKSKKYHKKKMTIKGRCSIMTTEIVPGVVMAVVSKNFPHLFPWWCVIFPLAKELYSSAPFVWILCVRQWIWWKFLTKKRQKKLIICLLEIFFAEKNQTNHKRRPILQKNSHWKMHPKIPRKKAKIHVWRLKAKRKSKNFTYLSFMTTCSMRPSHQFASSGVGNLWKIDKSFSFIWENFGLW